MHLEPDEIVQPVVLAETVHELVLVFPNAFDEVGCNADVEGSVLSACEDIYAWLLIHDGLRGVLWIGGDERTMDTGRKGCRL